MNQKIRVIIADDHPVVRAGIIGMLSGQPDFEVVAEAADGRETVRLAEAHRPDVVLMDLRMPGTDGVAATQELGERLPEIRVLVLTTYDTDADILRGVEAGATGYLLKGFFKTAKSRFSLDRFAQKEKVGVYRYLVLSMAAYLLAHWGHLCPVPGAWGTAGVGQGGAGDNGGGAFGDGGYGATRRDREATIPTSESWFRRTGVQVQDMSQAT